MIILGILLAALGSAALFALPWWIGPVWARTGGKWLLDAPDKIYTDMVTDLAKEAGWVVEPPVRFMSQKRYVHEASGIIVTFSYETTVEVGGETRRFNEWHPIHAPLKRMKAHADWVKSNNDSLASLERLTGVFRDMNTRH